jgi:hypothetical protein
MHAGYLKLQIYTQNILLIAVPLQQWLHQHASILGFACVVAYYWEDL